MFYYILPDIGLHIYRTSVQPFSDEDMQNPGVKKRLKSFYDKISVNIANNETLVDAEYPPELWHIDDTAYLDNPYLPYNPEAKIAEAYYCTYWDLDKYLTAQVLLPVRESYLMETANHHKRDANVNPVGISESNPILDTQQHEVNFDDVIVK